MKDFIERFICKNIIKILTIYKNCLDHDKLDFKNYLDQTIYFEIEELIRYIKEKNGEDEKERRKKMKFNEFVKKVKAMGGVDTDGCYGKQCMDLYNYYCNNVLGVQNVGADCAKNILNNQNIMANVVVIENTPEFIVQKGDIVVFRGIEPYGHVGICLGPADLNGFKCIEQNWSNTRQLEEVWHDYLYGNPVFLRPKNQTNIVDKTVEELAQEVIAGNWGNGEERVNRLTQAGYNAREVQNRVNAILGSNKKSTDEIAREVIAGKWGVGDERYQRLTKAGYDYNTVQARVNQLL